MAENNGNYHIYIHQTKEIIHKKVSAQSPTQFGKSRAGGSATAPKEVGDSSFKRFPSQLPFSNVANSVLSVTRNGASVGGVIGILVAAAKATEQVQKVAGKMNDLVATATGDYSYAVRYSNLAQYQHNLFHPVSSLLTSQMTQAEWARNNKRIDETRSLLGDTAINTLTKGV